MRRVVFLKHHRQKVSTVLYYAAAGPCFACLLELLVSAGLVSNVVRLFLTFSNSRAVLRSGAMEASQAHALSLQHTSARAVSKSTV